MCSLLEGLRLVFDTRSSGSVSLYGHLALDFFRELFSNNDHEKRVCWHVPISRSGDHWKGCHTYLLSKILLSLIIVESTCKNDDDLYAKSRARCTIYNLLSDQIRCSKFVLEL